MRNFIKTILSAMKSWTKKEIKKEIDNVSVVAPDWNENDSNSNDYIKNRTHWEEESEITILPKTTVTITEDGDGYTQLSDSVNILTIGQTYCVILNGIEYKCVARTYNDTDALIGNGTIYGDNNVGNNEPFSCDSYGDGNIYLNAAAGEYTISISTIEMVIHKLDSKYLDLPENLATTNDIQEVMDTANAAQNAANNAQTIVNDKMNKNNPTGTGSFSMNRKTGTTIGTNSHAEGNDTTASGYYSHAEGNGTKAYNDSSHAEGSLTEASNNYSHAEGVLTKASGDSSHSEGSNTIASGNFTHAEGFHTTAQRKSQHTQGEYNILDTQGNSTIRGKYAHIVGNGTADTERSNAHTLDWDGNAWYQGDIYVGSNSGTNQDEGSKKLATEEYVNTAIGGIEISEDSSSIELIADIVLEEETDSITITTDTEGKPFLLNGYYIYIRCPAAPGQEGLGYFRVYAYDAANKSVTPLCAGGPATTKEYFEAIAQIELSDKYNPILKTFMSRTNRYTNFTVPYQYGEWPITQNLTGPVVKLYFGVGAFYPAGTIIKIFKTR